METFFFRYRLHHVLFWAVYAGFWYWIARMSYPEAHRDSGKGMLIINGVYLFAHISASCISMYVLMPRLLFRKKYFLFSILLLLDILFFATVIALGFYLVFREQKEALEQIFRPASIIPATVFSVASITGVLSTAKLFQNRSRSEQKSNRLEKEKLETELKYLKSQINPHFLFNALNSIHVLIKKDPKQAGEALLMFSDMLRYQLYECDTGNISLSTELTHLQHYVILERIRRDRQLSIELSVPEDTNGIYITPLLLMPFIENVFKHVSSFDDGENRISIDLSVINKTSLVMQISNTFSKTPGEHPGGGIGIANVKRRLDLLFNEKYTLNITEDNNLYKLYISIPLYEDKMHDHR